MADDRKKLLLIAPGFFGYYQEIMAEAEKAGIHADYLCDTSSNSNVAKAVGRVNKGLLRGFMHRYFKQNVLPLIRRNQYDYVLLIAGMTCSFTPEMFGIIRKCQKNARFVIYQWDAQRNLPYVKSIHRFFDKIYSFDRLDCMEDSSCEFLPLFYIRKYEEVPSIENADIAYDCSYIGTAHPKKYKEINEMAAAVRGKMPRQYIYHYMPSKLKYIYHKILAPEYRHARLGEFQKEKVPADKMMEVFARSKCILDAPQEGQNGLTIRTIECLGAGRKLITTNKDIVNYDFYNEKNIFVFDQESDLNSSFFDCGFEPVPRHIYEKYALRNWLSIVLGF